METFLSWPRVLLFLSRFTDTAQGLGFLAALFGVITGLVGTYFGVKQSSDAREGTEQLALGGNTAPTVSITPATDRKAPSTAHTVTATVISVDGSSAANIPVTFRVTDGPDANTTDTATTDAGGQATFEITNHGAEGTDTIEAAALGGKGTATVEFKP
jgi:hypothetical protein